MRDLTQGSINRHLVAMAAPVMAGMLFQTLYLLVDLYFVGRLGNAAIAGVSAAGSVMLAIMAVTQSLGVGAVALVSQAVGRKQQADANLVFNQTLSLSVILMVVSLLLLYPLAPLFAAAVGADAETRRLGTQYLYAFIPAMAMQFLLVSLSSALRGTGIVKPAMVVQVLTVVLNIILAPILISGWGTGMALGVVGAGLSSTIAIGIGVAVLWVYFIRLEHYVAIDRALLRPRVEVWRRILSIGLPAGGEFIVMFLIWSCNYYVLRQLGAEAQAGFSVGQRVFQALFLPSMAVAFSVAPIVGQNYGARRLARVHQTFGAALRTGFIAVAPILLLCQLLPAPMVRVFSDDPAAIAIGVQYLHYSSWGLIFGTVTTVAGGVLQGVGNTWPGLLCSSSRVLSFILPAAYLSTRAGFNTREVWLAALLASVVNAGLIALFLRAWFQRHPAAAAA